ncbi:MAG TPA: protein kinase [Polyangiaceae bacterium]|jgi:serine/threonine protein kinase|nr:protein kinase [Polyangiaceae bacterium]
MPQPNIEISSLSQLGMQLGTVLGGKYRVDGVLGAGGMGVVLSATNLDLDAPVAIKVVRDELASNEEVVSRMVLEARSAAKLHSPHVVRIFDVARLESGAPYIVMERLAGGDLATLLAERGALSIREAVDYVLQACEGLAEAHALGIVHRDLKPENLFLAAMTEGAQLKILDFGISKDTTNSRRISPRTALTSAGCTVGSPFYMSPEQMRASPQIDRRADIWSLGAVLFELVTGKSPFDGESVPVVCAKVLNQDPPPLSAFLEQAPEQLEAIIRRCLAKDPDARYRDVGALASALRDFASLDGQRSADHSTRLASGVDVKRELAQIPNASTSMARPLRSSPTLPSATQTGGSFVSSASSYRYERRPARQRAATVIAVALAMAVAGGLVAIGRRGVAFAAIPHAHSKPVRAAAPVLAPASTAQPPPSSAPDVRAMPRPTEPNLDAAHQAPEPAEVSAVQRSRAAGVPARARSSVTARQASSANPKASAATDPGALYDLYWSTSSGHRAAPDDDDFGKLGGRY